MPRFGSISTPTTGRLKSPQKKAFASAIRVAKLGTLNPQRSVAIIGPYSPEGHDEIANKPPPISATALTAAQSRSDSHRPPENQEGGMVS